MTDSILIIGAGIAGAHAALECAAGGARVVLVERGPVIGGRLAAAMTRSTAIGNRAEGLEIPLFEALAENENIEILTNARLTNLDGGPGNFTASITEAARFVTDACTRCKLCHTACPVVRANEYDEGLTFRKAIYTPMSETLPAPYVIDIESCLNTPPNYLPCNRCVEVCKDNAIFFDMPMTTQHARHVGALILAPGFTLEDSSHYAELGYGKHPDILTSAELQRLLETPGPTGGYASRPSNEEYPEKILLILDNLSDFGLYIVASQVRQLLEQDIEAVEVLILAQPGGDSTSENARKLASDAGIAVHWGTMPSVNAGQDGGVDVSFEDLAERHFISKGYELVVLCTDVEPPPGLDALALATGIECSADGFLAVSEVDGSPIAASRPGIFVAGCASGAKNIKASIGDARAAATAALAQLDPRVLGVAPETMAEQDREERSLPPATPELQGQIEKLLYALLDRA